MAYNKRYPKWKDLPDKTTPLDAASLDHLEAGIAAAAATADSATTSAAGKYTLPAGGVPKVDLTVSVQAAIEKAVTAVQPSALADAIAGVVANAPGTMDTLAELSAALGGDPDFRNTVLGLIAAKAAADAVVTLVGAQTIAGMKNFAAGLQSGGKVVVVTDDARLSDERTPKGTTRAVWNAGTADAARLGLTPAELREAIVTAIGVTAPKHHTHDPDDVDGLLTEFSNIAGQLMGKVNSYPGQTIFNWAGTQAAYDALPTSEKYAAGFMAAIF
ncbi:hypothetical protein G8767_31645 [Rhodococcus sp. IC4_135]|uniref:hypothetical protein n=1 Tax=Rhodococcus sp. IC4_135 TaxID=2715537 RepID=UPI001423A56B|nr:hypothetical protein [Rhodococcus sp. IC4_135]